MVANEVRFVGVAIRRAHEQWAGVPCAAASAALCTSARNIRTAVCRRAAVAFHVAILDKVLDIAQHVIQPPRVWLERSDRSRPRVTIIAIGERISIMRFFLLQALIRDVLIGAAIIDVVPQ